MKKLISTSESLCAKIGENPGWIVSSVNFVVILAFIFGYTINRLGWAYQEVGFGTYYSGLQLIAIALCCFLISTKLAKSPIHEGARDYFIWKLAAIGFLYLFLDEIAQLHEKIDFAIHFLFIENKSDVTDSIDDVIVLIYAIFGGIFLLTNKKTFLKELEYKKTYILSFLVVLMMVALDVLTGGNFDFIFDDWGGGNASRLRSMAVFLEDSLKLWGGALILVAVSGTYALLRKAP